MLFFSNVTEPVIEATTHAQQVKHKGYKYTQANRETRHTWGDEST